MKYLLFITVLCSSINLTCMVYEQAKAKPAETESKKLITPTEAYQQCVEEFQLGDCTDMTFKECYMKAYIEGAMCVTIKMEEK